MRWLAILALSALLALAGPAAAGAQSPNGVDPKDVGGLYVGGSFRGLPLTSVTRQSFVYGECRPLPSPGEGCAFGLQIRRLSTCERHPVLLDGRPRLALRRYPARGALVVSYRGGGAVEVYTGEQTLLLYSTLRVRPRTLVAALRPVAGPWRLDRDLARPVLPAPVLRALAETRELHRRTGTVGATARRLRLSTAVVGDRLRLLRRLDALGASDRTTRC